MEWKELSRENARKKGISSKRSSDQIKKGVMDQRQEMRTGVSKTNAAKPN